MMCCHGMLKMSLLTLTVSPARLHEDAVAVAERVRVGCAVENCLHESGRDFRCHQALA